MNKFVALLAVLSVTACGAIADRNLELAYVWAYDKAPEATGSDTYRIESSAVIGPFDSAQPSVRVLTDGMRGSLAKAGKAAGYTTMQLESCRFTEIRRPSGHGVTGACIATMYREALSPQQGIYDIADEAAKADARRQSINR